MYKYSVNWFLIKNHIEDTQLVNLISLDYLKAI